MAKVTIYTTESCAWCKKTKAWFKEHNVNYVEKDVGKDAKAGEEAVEKSGQVGVPVSIIGKEVIVGFDEEKLKKALGIK